MDFLASSFGAGAAAGAAAGAIAGSAAGGVAPPPGASSVAFVRVSLGVAGAEFDAPQAVRSAEPTNKVATNFQFMIDLPCPPDFMAEVSGPEHGMRLILPSTSTFATRSENVSSRRQRMPPNDSPGVKSVLFFELLRCYARIQLSRLLGALGRCPFQMSDVRYHLYFGCFDIP